MTTSARCSPAPPPAISAAGDVVVVSQKVVSKAEGRVVRLADVAPASARAALAATHGKDPRAVEVVLDETAERRAGRCAAC